MHLYVELWNVRPQWLELSTEERKQYLDKAGSQIKKLTDTGVEIVGFAINDADTPHRSNYQYMAVWKMLGLEQVALLERSLEQAGWHAYFEQVNARGTLVPPSEALADMVAHADGS